MKCKNHAEVEAVARCMGCQEPFCSNCLVEINGNLNNLCNSCKVMGLKGRPVVVRKDTTPGNKAALTDKEKRNLEIYRKGCERQRKLWPFEVAIVLLVMFLVRNLIFSTSNSKESADKHQTFIEFEKSLGEVDKLLSELTEADQQLVQGYRSEMMRLYFLRLSTEGWDFYEANYPQLLTEELLLKKWLKYLAEAYSKFTPEEKMRVKRVNAELQGIIDRYTKEGSTLRNSR